VLVHTPSPGASRRPLPQAGEVYDDSRLVAANGCAVFICG
jgi:hypothetical protein